MTTNFELTAVFEPVEGGWVQGRIAEIPGVITAGENLEDAKVMLADALREYLLALGGEAPENATSGTQERLAVTLTL